MISLTGKKNKKKPKNLSTGGLTCHKSEALKGLIMHFFESGHSTNGGLLDLWITDHPDSAFMLESNDQGRRSTRGILDSFLSIRLTSHLISMFLPETVQNHLLPLQLQNYTYVMFNVARHQEGRTRIIIMLGSTLGNGHYLWWGGCK